jgi:hypothetical protein
VLALANRDGSYLHAEPRLIHVDLQPDRLEHLFNRRGQLATRRLAEVVTALTQPGGAIVRSLVHQHTLDRLAALATSEEHRRERQRRREKAIAEAIAPGQPSAAQLLVQAGLFDRRALRAASMHASALMARQDEMHEHAIRQTDVSPPARRLDLIAALFVPGR